VLYLGVVEETIKYIEDYGQHLVESITLIPNEHLGDYRGVTNAFRIQIEVLEGPATLVVGLPSDFPSKLPYFFDSQRQFGFIPHLEEDGFICFTRNENLVIDERFPGAAVLNCLEKVIYILENGESGTNNQEFLEEYEVYWGKICSMGGHVALDEDNETIRELDLYVIELQDNITLFSCEKKFKSPLLYISNFFHTDTSDLRKKRCLYIPLDEGTFIRPPRKGEVWSFAELKNNIFSNISRMKKEKLLQLIRNTPKSNNRLDYLVLSLSIESNKKALFGVVLHYPEGMIINRKMKMQLHPFIQKPPTINVIPFQITRHNQQYLLSRTGGDVALTSKIAVVIGVGSLGSVVAMGLAKAGYKFITLIDYDRMDIDNIYRHELGVDQVYSSNDPSKFSTQFKVNAMKEEIERKYPFTEVNAINKEIMVVLRGNQIDWSKVDLAIVCIGSPNVEMLINRFMHELPNSPPVLYSWIEPFGIGGHVIVTLNKEKTGCYQCLFKPISDEYPISNLSAFAAPGQSFTESLGGCGSYFTPYSFLDSEETVHLILRTANNVAQNRVHGNPIYSWKGDSSLFIEKGYKLSGRYQMSNEEIIANQRMFHNCFCPVCYSKESRT
jgi:molybdopterin/thiamine biosynthesis adenylyltransferase